MVGIKLGDGLIFYQLDDLFVEIVDFIVRAVRSEQVELLRPQVGNSLHLFKFKN